MKLGEKATLKSALQRILNEIIAIQELLRNLKERVIEKIFATVPVQAYNASQQHAQAVHQKPGSRMTTGNLANGHTCEPGRDPSRSSFQSQPIQLPTPSRISMQKRFHSTYPLPLAPGPYDNRKAMQGRKKAPQAMQITEGQGYEQEAKKLIQGPLKRTDTPLQDTTPRE